MSTIQQLSTYELHQLHSIDPILTPDWQPMLAKIIVQLDRDNRHLVFEKILKPKGIHYNPEIKGFRLTAPKTLSEVCQEHHITNKQLLKAVEQMMELCQTINPPPEDFDAVMLADEIEATLTFLDTVAVNPDRKEYLFRQKARQAFLYEFAQNLDKIHITMPETLRRIDENVFKCYFKEVFIKNILQGWNFKYWEAVDLDLYNITHFPKFITQEAKNRKLLLVETKDYWFLVAPAEVAGGNPFSIRRFLYEETIANFAYLNNIVIPKSLENNAVTQKFILLLVDRIYSLDNNINEQIKKFVVLLKRCTHETLAPILKEPFSAIGMNTERTIAKRTIKFEEALTSSVLQYLPTMFAMAKQSEMEREFLFGHLATFFSEILDLIENFRLHPLVKNSFVAQNLATKIVGFNIMLQKNKFWLCDQEAKREDQVKPFLEAMPSLRQSYEEHSESMNELEQLKGQIKSYEDKKDVGGFLQKLWVKMGFGKPKYTLEDLREYQKELNNDFFVDIIRLAKEHRKAVVHLEYESDYIPNEDFRHYIIANEEKGLARLPYVLSLPEDRELFSLENIKDDVYWQIFTHVYNV